jgi:catechol 2,3-dioxygenase-like lactoylglutathione lyase family enzyme
MQKSAVQFDTESRVHIALSVIDLDRSIAFYKALFSQEPTKTRPLYAKFEVPEPPLNLALNASRGPTKPNDSVAHFGIQVKSTAAVKEAGARLKEADLHFVVEDNVTCCYAVQDKIWVTDPDGNKWEVYVVLDNDAMSHASSSNDCCTGIRDVMAAIERNDMGEAMTAFRAAGGMSACSCLQAGG